MTEKTTILVEEAVREARRPRALSVHHSLMAGALALTLGLGSLTAFGLSNGTYAGADEVPSAATGAPGIKPLEGTPDGKGAKGAAGTKATEGAASVPSAEAEGEDALEQRTADDEPAVPTSPAEGETQDDAMAGGQQDSAEADGQPGDGAEGATGTDEDAASGNGNASASTGADQKPQANTAINLSTSDGISSILRSIDTAHELATLPVDKLLEEAMSHEGAPYVYGGTTPSGFDCSGFVLYCFRTALGMDLPRTAAAQSGLGTSVPMDSLERGDLLFWGSGGGVYHVGIYVGDGSYIHAAGDGQGVCVDTMTYFTPSFAKRLL